MEIVYVEEIEIQERSYKEPVLAKPFSPGVSGNPSGRPANTLKDYMSRKFRMMDDDEKEAWLLAHPIGGYDTWRMAEGNPHTTEDKTLTVKVPQPILGGATQAMTDGGAAALLEEGTAQ